MSLRTIYLGKKVPWPSPRSPTGTFEISFFNVGGRINYRFHLTFWQTRFASIVSTPPSSHFSLSPSLSLTLIDVTRRGSSSSGSSDAANNNGSSSSSIFVVYAWSVVVVAVAARLAFATRSLARSLLAKQKKTLFSLNAQSLFVPSFSLSFSDWPPPRSTP